MQLCNIGNIAPLPHDIDTDANIFKRGEYPYRFTDSYHNFTMSQLSDAITVVKRGMGYFEDISTHHAHLTPYRRVCCRYTGRHG